MKKYLIILITFLLPFTVRAEENLIPNAVSGILIEANSGKIIYEKEKNKQVSVASMTKMVAQIIILEEIEKKSIHWEDIVTVSRNASDMGGSQIYLEEGEKMSVRDLMKGISVASANDATVALAEYISGSEEKFVKRMNDKIKKLGLKNTHFVNCTGLDEENHYSSSYDMAMIARELITKHPTILEFSSIYEDYLRENTDHKFWLVNTNKLIRQYNGVDGLKTGHTDQAGYCLAATIERDHLRLIGIVLGEKDSKIRNKETIDLLDYGFSNVKTRVIEKKNKVVKKISLKKTNLSSINAVLGEDLVVIEDKNVSLKDYSLKVNINPFTYPLEKDSVIGNVDVYVREKKVSEAFLLSSSAVRKLSFFEFFERSFSNILMGNF